MMIPANDHTANDHVLIELFEELAELRSSSNSEAVEEFLAAHPDYADRLRVLLPALDALGSCREESSSGETGLSSNSAGESRAGSVNSGPQNAAERQEGNRKLPNEAVNSDDLASELFRLGWVAQRQVEEIRHSATGFSIEQNRYVLRDLIGRGGMGSVFKARHTLMRRDVALKVIDRARTTDDSLVDRFRREVEVCSRLQNEHIVLAFDVGMHEGAMFLVLEFVDGLNLASLVKRDGPMQPGEAAAICLQAAAGLAYAHSQGIIHRDIKPQNILLSTSGVVKILDMGLARVLDETGDDPHTSLTQEGAVMGTVDYMPPEQARDTRSADARSDIYSLGATLYYLLAGKPPFAGGSMIEKLHRLATEAPPPLTEFRIDCPRELDDIVQKMLAKRPEDRFQTAGEVVRALRPLAAERISGRAAVTAAVQSAADTLQVAGKAPTDAEVLFSQMDESLLESVRQRQAPTKSISRKQMLKLSAIVGALLVAVAAIGWSLSGPTIPPPSKMGEEVPKPRPVASLPQHIRRVVPGHYAGVCRVALSPDGRFLATGGGEGEVHVRDLNSRNKKPIVFDRHHAAICNLLWSQDGALIVSGDAYGEIHVWQARSGQAVAQAKRNKVINGHQFGHHELGTVAISPDNAEIAFEENGIVVRYNLEEKRQIWSAPGGGAWLRYSPSGRLLVSSLGPYVWDTVTGESVYRMALGPAEDERSVPGFLADDTLVLVKEQTIGLWNCAEGALIDELKTPKAMVWTGRWVPVVAVSPAGDLCRVLTQTESIEIHLPDGAMTRHAWKLAPRESLPGTNAVAFLHWDVNFPRAIFAAAQIATARVYDLNTGEQIASIEADYIHRSDTDIARPIGNRYLLAGGHVWDLVEAAITTEVPATSRVIDGKYIRYIEDDQVYTRSLLPRPVDVGHAPVLLDELADARETWPALRLTEDGKMVFDPKSDAAEWRFWDASTGAICRRIDGSDFDGSIAGVASADGGIVARVSRSNRRMLRLFRMPEGQPPLKAAELPYEVQRVAISPDGRLLAPSAVEGAGNDTIVLWNTSDGRKRAPIPTELPNMVDPHIAQFSSSGRYLLVTRRLWDLTAEPPKSIWECPEQDHAVGMYRSFLNRAGALFPDERHVLIVQDAQFQIWDWRENKKLATLFLLPGDEAVFVNHLTGHFSETASAYQYLRTDFDRGDGRPPVEVTIREYEKATGWKNDPAQAGLDLEKRNRELAEKPKAK